VRGARAVEKNLAEAIEEQQRAAEERTSREILRSIHRAFREALIALPAEEYDWFSIPDSRETTREGSGGTGLPPGGTETLGTVSGSESGPRQREFSSFRALYTERSFRRLRAACRWVSGRIFGPWRGTGSAVCAGKPDVSWEIVEGPGELLDAGSEITTFRRPKNLD